MSAHEPQDPHIDAPAGVLSAPCGVPTVRDVLAACAAAHTVSTPPPRPAVAPEPTPERPADAA